VVQVDIGGEANQVTRLDLSSNSTASTTSSSGSGGWNNVNEMSCAVLDVLPVDDADSTWYQFSVLFAISAPHSPERIGLIHFSTTEDGKQFSTDRFIRMACHS
jgi:hypothetical protein